MQLGGQRGTARQAKASAVLAVDMERRRTDFLWVVQTVLLAQHDAERPQHATRDDPSVFLTGVAQRMAAAVAYSHELDATRSGAEAAQDYVVSLLSADEKGSADGMGPIQQAEFERSIPRRRLVSAADSERIEAYLHKHPRSRVGDLRKLTPHLDGYQLHYLLEDLCRKQRAHRVGRVWLYPGPAPIDERLEPL